jgi:hypothetical protein
MIAAQLRIPYLKKLENFRVEFFLRENLSSRSFTSDLSKGGSRAGGGRGWLRCGCRDSFRSRYSFGSRYF